MLDRSAIEAIRELNEPVAIGLVEGHRLFLPPGWQDETPRPATPEPIGLSTLSGLVAYIIQNTDDLALEKCLLVVKAHAVALGGPLEGISRSYTRSTFANARFEKDVNFGVFYSPEEFIVKLQANFVPTPDRDKLLELLSTIREGAIRETIDDGLTQEVRTQKGVSLVKMTAVPNPVTLQPFRTFPEIEQPLSQFIVRMRPGPDGKPAIALFEAEGNAWELVAIERIRDYLEAALLNGRPPGDDGSRRLPAIIA